MNRSHRIFGLAMLCWIVIDALVLRLCAIHTRPLGVEIDGLGYWTMATNWVEGKGFVDQHGNLSFLNSGYALMLGVLYSVFGNGMLVGAYANVFLSVASVLLCYRLGCLMGSRGVGLWAAGLWAIYLPSVVYTTYLAKENLQIPLVLGAICIGIQWTRQPARLIWPTMLGLLTGVLALVSATGTIFGVALLLYMPVRHLPPQQAHKQWVLWTVGCLVIVTPWLMRNDRVLGAHVLNTNSGLNLLLGNRDAATMGYTGLEGTEFQERWLELRERGGQGELAADREARALAVSYIKDHPAESLGRWMKRWLHFWAIPKLEGASQSKLEMLLRIVWRIQYLLILLAALAAWRMAKRVRFLWALVLVWALAHAPFFVMPRFQLVAIPLLCVLAALNWLSVERKAQEELGTGPQHAPV